MSSIYPSRNPTGQNQWVPRSVETEPRTGINQRLRQTEMVRTTGQTQPHWCRCVLSSGTRHFFGHCLTIIFFLLLLFVAGAWFLPNIQLKNHPVIQNKIAEVLEGTGIGIDFQNIQFVSGKGIRVSGVEVTLTDTGQRKDDATNRLSNPEQSIHQGEARFRPVSSNRKYDEGFPQQSRWTVQEVWIVGDWSPVNFLSPDFRPERIELVGAHIKLRQDSEGRIQIPSIRLPKSTKDKPSINAFLKSIHLVNSTISISAKENKRPLVLSNINVNLSNLSLVSESLPRSNSKTEVTFRPVSDFSEQSNRPGVVSNGSVQVEKSKQHHFHEGTFPADTKEKGRWQIDAHFRPDGFDPVDITGWVDAKRYSIQLRTRVIHVHHRFWEIVGPYVPLDKLANTKISGWVYVDKLSVEGNIPSSSLQGSQRLDRRPSQEGDRFQPGRNQANKSSFVPKISFSGRIKEGLVRDPRLAQPVMDISTRFQIDQYGAKFEDVKARVAGGTIEGRLEKFSWSDKRCEFSVVGTHLPFGPEWVQTLLPRYQKKYPDFLPEGRFDCRMDYRMGPKGKLYKKGTIDIKDMSFKYVRFPVKISNVFGRFSIDDNLAEYHLVAKDPEYPIQLDGWFIPKGDQWKGRIDVKSVRFHPFGQSILQAFSPFPRTVSVLKSLNASGQLATAGSIVKKSFGQKPDIRFTTRIQGGEVQHDQFPYRIAGVHGDIEFENGKVSVQKLEGTGTTGNITAKAFFHGQDPWWIDLHANALELNQSLYRSLKPEFQEVWDRLQPHGVLDRVQVQLSGGPGLPIKTSLSCTQDPSAGNRRSFLSITPVSFPYRLDSVSGSLKFEDGTVWLDTIRASHRNVKLGFDGKGSIRSDHWNFLLTNLLAAQVPVDADLKAALPLSIRNVVDRLGFQGHLGVSGSISIGMRRNQAAGILDKQRKPQNNKIALVGWQVNNPSPAVPDVNWNLRLDLVNSRIDSGVPFRNMHGVVNLLGARKDGRAFSYGSLDIDSAMIQGFHFRNVKGPFSVSSNECSFGSAAHRARPDQPVKSLSGFLLGGRMEVDGRVLLKRNTPFVLQATANHIDLKKVTRRFTSSATNVSGMGYGSVSLKGDSGGADSLTGNGIVRIKDAKLYEIPVFLQLLKILQVRTPDRTAFDEGKIDFSIARKELLMNRIELLGNAISLIGKGSVGFDQTLDLDFYTALGRNRFYLPVLSEIIKASSQQLLWISIEGTIGNPKTKREVLRALNEAVRNLMNDVQAASRNGP